MRQANWYAQFAKSTAHFCGRPRVFTLAVGTQLDGDPKVIELLGGCSDVDVVPFVLRLHDPTPRDGVEDAARDIFGQARIGPDVAVLIPVVLA